MADTDSAPAPAADDAHPAASPADDHGSDGHGAEHASEPLGPVDSQAWMGAVIGGAIAVVLLIAMLVAIGDL